MEKSLGEGKGRHVQVTFQKMLACRAWLDKIEFWQANDTDGKESAAQAIKQCFQHLVSNFLRQKSQGWNLPKLHKQLHTRRRWLEHCISSIDSTHTVCET